MEKQTKFKLKFPKIFTSSCKTQNLSEVIDHKTPIFTPQKPIFLQTPLMEEDDPKQTPSSSSMLCKPRCPETFDHMVLENCIFSTSGNPFPRRKFSGDFYGGRRCPPASPASPLFQNQGKNNKKKKKKKKKKKSKGIKNENTHLMNFKKNENPNLFSFSSSNETDHIGDWFSSDDEREDDETETLFSSRSMSVSISLSSDSDPLDPARTRARNRRRKASSRPRVLGMTPLQGKVKDTFAVVKSSSDPYNDFRTSMVEMIIEKQIFGAKELEQLLQCFLSLNSPHHHRVIVEVFTEIWDALFSYCC